MTAGQLLYWLQYIVASLKGGIFEHRLILDTSRGDLHSRFALAEQDSDTTC